jgi:hypothetical protein
MANVSTTKPDIATGDSWVHWEWSIGLGGFFYVAVVYDVFRHALILCVFRIIDDKYALALCRLCIVSESVYHLDTFRRAVWAALRAVSGFLWRTSPRATCTVAWATVLFAAWTTMHGRQWFVAMRTIHHIPLRIV